jgi:nitrogen fixation/metabolism regulation signal transduction histidine kinase
LVLEAVVKLLTNPIFLKMVLLLFASAFAVVMAWLMMRRVRRSLSEGDTIPNVAGTASQLPLHTYHAVIQQLKQQKHELSTMRDAETRRARSSEIISAAVLSNLSIGVIFFGPNGLVRQANHAAKSILGIASPTGMNGDELFRQTTIVAGSGETTLADKVALSMSEGKLVQGLQVEHRTPAGEQKVLEVTASCVPGADGSPLGVALLINDQSEIANIRRQIELRGELSAEMALALRASLVTISGYAQQLARNHDPELAAQIAADIAAEAKHLDRTIGGFLAESTKAQAVSAARA